MKQVVEIIKELQSTSSRIEKERILSENKDNELLKCIFEFVYNPYIVSGISSKKLKKKVKVNGYNIKSLEVLMEYLKKNNTGRDIDIATVQGYLFFLTENEKEIVSQIITKSLKIGCTSKTLNKIYGEGFIPEFSVMLAESFFKQKEDFLNGKEFLLTQKIDGNRLVIIKHDNEIHCFSRQGQEIEGLVDITNDLDWLPNDYVLDGELVAINYNDLPSDELFRLTMKIARKDGIKKDLEYNVFDLIKYDEFIKGKSSVNCRSRKAMLHALIEDNDPKFIKEVKVLYQGKDKNEIYKWLEWARNNNMEGIMINLSESPYECKRTKNILKVKVMQDVDLKVVGLEEGSGNLKGTLGRINVEFKDNVVGVGSGFELSMRDEIWNNKDKYLGAVAQIQYFEVSTNQKDGKESLRFPVFKCWRFDKDEPSLY